MIWTVKIQFKDTSHTTTVHETSDEPKLQAAEVLDEILCTGKINHPDGPAIFANTAEIKTIEVSQGSRGFIETRTHKPAAEARRFGAGVKD